MDDGKGLLTVKHFPTEQASVLPNIIAYCADAAYLNLAQSIRVLGFNPQTKRTDSF